MLGFLGITDWMMLSKKWRPKQSPAFLEIKGSYVNSCKKKVSFTEIHEFSKETKTQYLFTKID